MVGIEGVEQFFGIVLIVNDQVRIFEHDGIRPGIVTLIAIGVAFDLHVTCGSLGKIVGSQFNPVTTAVRTTLALVLEYHVRAPVVDDGKVRLGVTGIETRPPGVNRILSGDRDIGCPPGLGADCRSPGIITLVGCGRVFLFPCAGLG